MINGGLEPHDLAGGCALLQQEAPAGDGILVGNHYIIAAIAEARLPNRYELDRWLPGRKVAIYSTVSYTHLDVYKRQVLMANIRSKIETDTANPRYILTEVGVGYRFVDE